MENTSMLARNNKTYYQSVIRILIDSDAQNLSKQATADRLNSHHLLTPTGLIWSALHITQAGKKLRNTDKYGSKLHYAFLELILAGVFTVEESLPLFKRC